VASGGEKGAGARRKGLDLAVYVIGELNEKDRGCKEAEEKKKTRKGGHAETFS